MRWLGTLLLVAGCTRADPPAPPASSSPPRAVAPIRGAAGDDDVRAMLSEIAAAKACDMIEGQFRELRAPDDPTIVTGVLWIRGCKITSAGTQLTFRLDGNGWQWAAQTKHKGGGTFVVKQYVKFGVTATFHGALDIAYDRGTHVASLWFTPAGTPDVAFTPIGEVDVDRKGTWSSIVGALGSAFTDSPETIAAHEAKGQGTHQFQQQLADGLAVTIDLCTGLQRFNLGRQPKGRMQPADAGETMRVPVELEPGGLVMFGPQLAPAGMSVSVEAPYGNVRASLVCAKDAATLAETYVQTNGQLAAVPALASADVRGRARLAIKRARCPVVMVAQSTDPDRAVSLAWERPAREIARSLGGPIVRCAR